MLTLQKQLFVQKILDKPPNQVVKTQNNKNIGNEAYTKLQKTITPSGLNRFYLYFKLSSSFISHFRRKTYFISLVFFFPSLHKALVFSDVLFHVPPTKYKMTET